MEKEYYAFISYNREDEKWAKWLQKKLESYKLPVIIHKENPSLPKRIYPVFRDKTDMEAGPITDNVRNELENSKYLIVICSPKAAKSGWVGKEITMFTETGRADRIIPFVVDGTPKSGDEQECFHQVIKENIPDVLGININEIGREEAFIKVTAKLLGLRFNVLWDRLLREKKKKQVITASAGLLFLIAAGIGLYLWGPKREYYADYVDRWGIPEGVIELKKSQVKKRYAHYRFEYLWGRVERVVYANSVGTPIEHTNIEYADRFSIQELEYKSNQLVTSVLKNSKGKTILVLDWKGEDHDRIDIRSNVERDSGNLAASCVSISSNLYNTINLDNDRYKKRAEIRRYKLTREDGYIVRKEFVENNDDNYRTYDYNGFVGFAYNLGNFGRPDKIYYLDFKWYKDDKFGVMGRKYEYDSYGNICKVVYFGGDDVFGEDTEPVLNEQLWSIAEYKADENGNIISEAYFDTKNKPCFHIDGYAKTEIEYYDNSGRVKSISYFDTDGNPCFNNFGYAKAAFKYDKHGRINEESYFDTNGNPCYNKDGIAGWNAKYDGQGNMLEIAYFDINGKPCYSKDGVAGWNAGYDNHGNMTWQSFFGADRKPCLYKDSFSYCSAEYNSREREEISSFSGGASDFKMVSRFEENYQGNYEWVNFVDSRGNPYVIEKGISGYYTEFITGRITRKAYFGADSRLCLLPETGYARVEISYDYVGNIKEEYYFDEHGDSYQKAIFSYDKWGNRIEELYFGPNYDSYGYDDSYGQVNKKREYDNRRNMISESYFMVDGTDRYPCFNYAGGFAKLTREYDVRGNITTEAYFDRDGNPCFSEYIGYARITFEYDARGNMTSMSFFDTDDNPCLYNGFAKITAIYDDRDNVIEVTLYDDLDNIIEVTLYDTDGNPVP